MHSLKPLTIATLLTLSAVTAQALTTQEIGAVYTATFDRVPDKEGVEYWLNSGLSIEEIAQSFFDQEETQAKYPEATTVEEFIEAVYQNLFARESDTSGLEYWKEQLESGTIAKAHFIIALINGAQDTEMGNDKTILEEKTKISTAFLDADIEYEKYGKGLMQKYKEQGLEEALDEIEEAQGSQKEAEQIQAELDSFDTKFATEEFAEYSGKVALRAKVASGDITAFKAETTARKEINAIKLAEQNKIDEAELEAALYDSTDLTSTQENNVKKVFNEDGLADALAKIKEYEEENEAAKNAYVPPSSGGGSTYVPPSGGGDTGGATGGSGNGNGTNEGGI